MTLTEGLTVFCSWFAAGCMLSAFVAYAMHLPWRHTGMQLAAIVTGINLAINLWLWNVGYVALWGALTAALISADRGMDKDERRRNRDR